MLEVEAALRLWHNFQFRITYFQILHLTSKLLFPNGFVPEAVHEVIVDHSYRLHVRIADECSDKLEAACLEVLTHQVGLW